MPADQAIPRTQAVIRLRHLSLSTEPSDGGWLRRCVRFLPTQPATATSEQKLEAFGSELARQGVSASTQNQAFSALLFLYPEVLGLSLRKADARRATRRAGGGSGRAWLPQPVDERSQERVSSHNRQSEVI